ncbi:unnamed protein product [Diamesa tonsa]
MPPKGTCPWPKGRYTVNNFFLNLDNIPPVFSTGEYRLNCEFYLDGVLQNGVIILLDMYTTNSYKKAGNAWKKLPYKYGPFPFCQYMDGEKFFFDAVRKVADLPAKGTCPWPKGTYHINNYVMTIENIPPVFSSGEYKLEGVVALDGKLANGLNFLIDLVSIQ